MPHAEAFPVEDDKEAVSATTNASSSTLVSGGSSTLIPQSMFESPGSPIPPSRSKSIRSKDQQSTSGVAVASSGSVGFSGTTGTGNTDENSLSSSASISMVAPSPLGGKNRTKSVNSDLSSLIADQSNSFASVSPRGVNTGSSTGADARANASSGNSSHSSSSATSNASSTSSNNNTSMIHHLAPGKDELALKREREAREFNENSTMNSKPFSTSTIMNMAPMAMGASASSTSANAAAGSQKGPNMGPTGQSSNSGGEGHFSAVAAIRPRKMHVPQTPDSLVTVSGLL